MAKCRRCGKSLFMGGKIKLKDTAICRKCMEELGFSPISVYIASMSNYSYDDIKDGMSAYYQRQKKKSEEFRANNPELARMIDNLGEEKSDEEEAAHNVTINVDHNINIGTPFKMANYGQKREVNETDGEAEMFNILRRMFPEKNFELCRKSDDYVTAMLGEWDVIRFKCSDKAKWIMLPVLEKPTKHYIDGPRYIEDFEASIKESMDFIKKAQN